MRENWKGARKTIPVVMILLIVLVGSMFLYIGPASVRANSGAVIDIFDNATPSGKGINQSSGPFAPQQLVILYANVTYNGAPVDNKLVAFEVTDPTSNIIFSGSNATDADGIATVRFRLATNATFGTWTVIASVDVAQVAVHDYLWFRVGWIITITSITTLNAELKPQTVFHRQDVIVFNLTLENIALTNETCTIEVDVEDAAQYSIIQFELTDLTLTPGENYVLSNSSRIPITATIGLATVYAAPYTAPIEDGGVLYSPVISTTFEIELVQVPDIGISNITLSSNSVFIGETLRINVTVFNNGTEVVAFNVSVYYNSSFLIETIPVSILEPASQVTLTFTWNTASVAEGYYQISASAPLPGDPTPWDNTLVDGLVQVKTKPLYPDIAVTNIRLSSTCVFIGQTVQINVTIVNTGTEVVAFNVSTYYNNSLIETIPVSILEPASQVTLTFTWNTASVAEGYYQISASAPLPGDPTPWDNTLVDGLVQVKTKLPYPPLPFALLWLIVFIFIVVVIASLVLLIVPLLFYLRRRRKKKPARYLYTAIMYPQI